MYLGPRPRRRTPRLTILLLLSILAATLVVHYIATYRPHWANPFEPTPTPTWPASYYLAAGEGYYGEGQLDEAIAAYQRAAAMLPEEPAVHIRLAQLLILRERSAEALAAARRAVLLSPRNAQAVAIFCRALDWEGLYAEALDACECAVELDERYAEAYAYLSEVYADLGNWTAARNYAQQAVERNYQSLDAHRNQGYAYELQGRYSKAVEAYENALRLHPRLVPLYLSAARNYRAVGRYKEAIDRLERAIRIEPNNSKPYDQLGWTYYLKGDVNRAVQYLEQATEINPEDAQAWGHLGLVHYVTQHYEDAIPALQRAIQLFQREYLTRARRLSIWTQDTHYDPPRPVEVMRGEFEPLYRTGVTALTAQLHPLSTERKAILRSGETCGDVLAARLGQSMPINQTVLSDATPSPPPGSETPEPANPLLGSKGEATLHLQDGRLQVMLHALPPAPAQPYKVQLLMWPGKTLDVGELQPDASGNAALVFNFQDVYPAPVEYYYTLGFSYVHLDQCSKGVPWLEISLKIDSTATNPAWQGLAECAEKGAAGSSTSSAGTP
ncbi:MAG: tetratricopeptide repeat protein [Anaerolineae bacterium]|nr:tetratricopeptide repeat protein [Anaerolineae bacterium]MDW8071590.1 tetratricopeptide repeat protein [Anaerolineae bacterium]